MTPGSQPPGSGTPAGWSPAPHSPPAGYYPPPTASQPAQASARPLGVTIVAVLTVLGAALTAMGLVGVVPEASYLMGIQVPVAAFLAVNGLVVVASLLVALGLFQMKTIAWQGYLALAVWSIADNLATAPLVPTIIRDAVATTPDFGELEPSVREAAIAFAIAIAYAIVVLTVAYFVATGVYLYMKRDAFKD